VEVEFIKIKRKDGKMERKSVKKATRRA